VSQRACARRRRAAAPVLVLLLALLTGSVHAGLTPEYTALLTQVAAGNEADRRTFARVALEQMAASYEAELARSRGADGRWRRFMQQEATALRARAARVDDTLRITLARDGPDGVRLIIDGENVIVASPRLDAPERLEAAIVAEACLYLPCRDAAAGLAGGEATTGAAATAAREAFGPKDDPGARTWPRLAVSGTGLAPGRWYPLEGGGATYRTANGLNFQFRQPGSEQAAFAALCDRIGADFENLAAALAHARTQRWPLVWEFLRLGPTLQGEQAVVINPLGDAFLLPLAEPAILGRLLPSAQAWLQRRASGEGSQHYFPEADRLLPLAGRVLTGSEETNGAAPRANDATSADAAAGLAPLPPLVPDAPVAPPPPGWRPL